ncbi:MAG: LCP family protein, partial [Candidatus Terrybacteria bacterium]|nr:LCP family protein [Candidatus Terrybacteria bacterium]
MAFDIVSPKEAQEQGRSPRVVIEMKPRSAGPRWWLRIATLFFFIGIAVFGFLTVKAGTTFSVVSERVTSFLGVEPSRLPLSDPREKDRIDFLLLGLRGEGDPHGGLLTDTMMVVSIHTARDEVALISLPRDTYLTIPIVQQRAKINEAFAIGEQQLPQGGGLF